MTDLSLVAKSGPRRHDHTSPAALAHLKARYRAEARFRFYGIAAVALACIAVVVLLSDIIVKGMPAFIEHRVQLPVTLDASKIDVDGKRELASLRAGDYQALTRDALREIFPEVKDRRTRRILDGLVSTGAPDDLRAHVIAQPGDIGKTIAFSLLLSDDADLYLKGIGSKIDNRAGLGSLAVSAREGEVEISSSAAEFSGPLAIIKAELAQKARALNLEIERIGAQRQPGTDAILDAKVKEMRERAAELLARSVVAQASETLDSTMPSVILAAHGGLIKLTEISGSTAKGITLVPLAKADALKGGEWRFLTYLTPESARKITDQEIAWLETFKAQGKIEKGFATRFFVNGDSREPELAGVRGALLGSALTLFVTLVLCLPIGVMAAIYLEEFAPKNRFTDFLEVNINNLAAVPSIVFGLLGLAMFLNFIGLPRSAPLVGGLVLALLVLPTIIIAARAALKSVPPSIKEAALALGASHQQAVFHHVLPLAMPGIMTGTIIGMAHALGETAPLLMIGMVAFIVEVPKSLVDAATVLPVQIYLWSDLPEQAFQAKTAAAIMVLLAFLFLMNGLAILLRRRFERRW